MYLLKKKIFFLADKVRNMRREGIKKLDKELLMEGLQGLKIFSN